LGRGVSLAARVSAEYEFNERRCQQHNRITNDEEIQYSDFCRRVAGVIFDLKKRFFSARWIGNASLRLNALRSFVVA